MRLTPHPTRCTRSRSKRCRCECGGRLHGRANEGEVGAFADEQAPGVLRELGETFGRVRQAIEQNGGQLHLLDEPVEEVAR